MNKIKTLWFISLVACIPLNGVAEHTYNKDFNPHGDYHHHGHRLSYPFGWGQAHCRQIHKLTIALETQEINMKRLEEEIKGIYEIIGYPSG